MCALKRLVENSLHWLFIDIHFLNAAPPADVAALCPPLLVYLVATLTHRPRLWHRCWLMNGYTPVTRTTSTPNLLHVCDAVMRRWPLKVGPRRGQHRDRCGVKITSPLGLLHLPPRHARPPAPAFHSNLMIMIFAQDDLCLHSVITPPCFLWSQLLEIDGP